MALGFYLLKECVHFYKDAWYVNKRITYMWLIYRRVQSKVLKKDTDFGIPGNFYDSAAKTLFVYCI